MLYFQISQKRLTLCLTNGCSSAQIKVSREGSLLRCFRSFLIDRKQRVVVRGTHSSWSCVTLDVPQGTILGPILFVIYVNDISSNISSTLRMFPDDTKVYRELSNIARDNEARYNLMSISYYPGHLNGNYALVPLNARFYNARTRPLPPYIPRWVRALKA